MAKTSWPEASNFAGMRTGGNSAVGASEVDAVIVTAVLVTTGSLTIGIELLASLLPVAFNLFSLFNVDFVDPPDVVDVRFLFLVDPGGRPRPRGAFHELRG
jgi:hypothetical protein